MKRGEGKLQMSCEIKESIHAILKSCNANYKGRLKSVARIYELIAINLCEAHTNCGHRACFIASDRHRGIDLPLIRDESWARVSR